MIRIIPNPDSVPMPQNEHIDDILQEEFLTLFNNVKGRFDVKLNRANPVCRDPSHSSFDNNIVITVFDEAVSYKINACCPNFESEIRSISNF